MPTKTKKKGRKAAAPVKTKPKAKKAAKKRTPAPVESNGRGKVTLNASLLVGLTEISEKADVSRSAVGNWVMRYEDFPEAVVILASGPVFYWPEVKKWLRETGRV